MTDTRSLIAGRGLVGVQTRTRQARYTLQLLLGNRWWVFLIADFFLIIQGLVNALIGEASLPAIYNQAAVIPGLLLAPPILSGIVALERRAGSLDMALAVPSTESYFLRRVAPVCGFFLAQGWALMVLAVALNPTGRTTVGDVARSMFQSIEIVLLIAAATLFWAVRLKTAGGVLLGSGATLAAFLPWIFESPFGIRSGLPENQLLGLSRDLWAWMWNAVVLALAATILYLYARQRLRRPETMLT